MKHWLSACLVCFGSTAHAAPYFRLLRPLDEVKSGAFVKVGTPDDRIMYGFQTTLLKHQSADGFLFIPGVSWSLLDLGAAKSQAGSFHAILGPSVDVSEPVKAVLLRLVKAVYPETFGSVKALLAPAVDGKACVAASLGPGLAADLGGLKAVRDIKGALVIHAGLSAKW